MMGTMGTPSFFSRYPTSMRSPRASTSSIMFSATTMGSPTSIRVRVRLRLRSRLVASTMLIMPFTSPDKRKRLVTCSSKE